MSIGKRIRALREEKGLTQKQLSEMSGMSGICYYEAGKVKPSYEIVKHIANALGVCVSDLVVNPNELSPGEITAQCTPEKRRKLFEDSYALLKQLECLRLNGRLMEGVRVWTVEADKPECRVEGRGGR